MALKGTKRASSAGVSGSPAKKRNVSAQKKLSTVGDALMSVELPPQVCQMLSNTLKDSLGVGTDKRQPFQVKVVGWIGAALTAELEARKKKLEAAEAEVANADSEKAGLQAAVTEAEGKITSQQEVVEKTKEDAKAATVATKDAKKALKEATHEQGEGDKELETEEKEKAKLEGALNNTFKPLQENGSAADDVQAKINELAKLGQKEGFEPSMLTSLPSALGKVPSDRGTFDLLVLGQIEQVLTKRIGDLDEKLAAGAEGKTARADKVAAANTAVEAATEAEETAKAAARAAAAELKSLQKAKEEAASAVENFEDTVSSRKDVLKATKNSVADLEEGALAFFHDLEEAVSPELAAQRAAEARAEAKAKAEAEKKEAAEKAAAEAAAAAAAAAETQPAEA